MNSRQRVLTTLSHQEPDRVPVDFGATMETTIHIRAYQALKQRLEICGDSPVVEMLRTSGFARPDEDVQRHLGADVRGVFPNRRYTLDGEQLIDEFGIGWRRPADDGLYYDICSHPMAGMTFAEIERYPFPDPRDPQLLKSIEGMLSDIRGSAFPVVFDNCFGNGIFQTCNQLMGYDVFLMAMALGERKADYLMDRILELKMQFWDEVLARFGDRIDILKQLDDMGTQANLLISPEMYRQSIKPRLKHLIDFIKGKAPHVKMMMHSCGSIRKIIPDLIDCGVEILNPVQYSAADMNPVELKREFGDDLTFWGGGIDTQKVLPAGTVQEVKDEVKRMLDVFMPGGGYVFAPVHAIQADVPVENMLAMWETVAEYGAY
jgi:uroporphyrinogen decarboxylase